MEDGEGDRLAPSAWDADRRGSRGGWARRWPPPPVATLPMQDQEAPASAAAAVQRLHGDRHRRHRRPVVQRLGLEGPAGGQGRRSSNVETKNVASKRRGRLRAEPDAVRQPGVQLHPGGRRPDGRRDQEGRRGEPEPAVRHRRRQAPGETNVYPMQFDTAQAAFLAGYLAAGYSKTGKVGHLRRPEDPAGDHLHGRLRRRRGALQPAKSKNVQVLGWNKATQNGTLRRRLHRPGQGQEASATRWSPRAPT